MAKGLGVEKNKSAGSRRYVYPECPKVSRPGKAFVGPGTKVKDKNPLKKTLLMLNIFHQSFRRGELVNWREEIPLNQITIHLIS